MFGVGTLELANTEAVVIYGRLALLARHVIAVHDIITFGRTRDMTVLLQMWVGRQRQRRQEFQVSLAPIRGEYVQATTYVLIRSGQPKSRDPAVTCGLTPAAWRYSPRSGVRMFAH